MTFIASAVLIAALMLSSILVDRGKQNLRLCGVPLVWIAGLCGFLLNTPTFSEQPLDSSSRDYTTLRRRLATRWGESECWETPLQARAEMYGRTVPVVTTWLTEMTAIVVTLPVVLIVVLPCRMQAIHTSIVECTRNHTTSGNICAQSQCSLDEPITTDDSLTLSDSFF